MPKSVKIELKGKTGEVADTRYYSNSRILTYEEGQLTRDRLEAVDFTVTAHTKAYDPDRQLLKFTVKTTRKDGAVELHDLAFPELGEQIDYIVRGNGQVLQAGAYSPQSLFFVPALPISEKPVEVGDTWTMEHTWISAKDSVPLKLDVVGILKNIVPCESTKVCADIEVSGHVTLVAVPTNEGAKFESRVWGRMLFSLERGDVLWSEMRSSEEMGVKGDKMRVTSCMVSEIKAAADYKIKFSCDPAEQAVAAVPTL